MSMKKSAKKLSSFNPPLQSSKDVQRILDSYQKKIERDLHIHLQKDTGCRLQTSLNKQRLKSQQQRGRALKQAENRRLIAATSRNSERNDKHVSECKDTEGSASKHQPLSVTVNNYSSSGGGRAGTFMKHSQLLQRIQQEHRNSIGYMPESVSAACSPNALKSL